MPTRHTPLDRQKAATAYLVHGNSKAASRACGIPASTIRDWARTPEFQELVSLVRLDMAKLAGDSLRRIFLASLDNIEDRLRNGDVVLNRKTGQTVRRPVTALDAARIGALMRDCLRE
jgi:hypothetical protein